MLYTRDYKVNSVQFQHRQYTALDQKGKTNQKPFLFPRIAHSSNSDTVQFSAEELWINLWLVSQERKSVTGITAQYPLSANKKNPRFCPFFPYTINYKQPQKMLKTKLKCANKSNNLRYYNLIIWMSRHLTCMYVSVDVRIYR